MASPRGVASGVYGTHDQIWSSFWVQLEASVSVIMVSTMLFKTLFVVNKSPNIDKNSPPYRTRLWRRKKTPELLEVETGATMTGMRTMIRKNGRTLLGSFGKDESQRSVGSSHWAPSNDVSMMED
jgi:hypothetical protein